METDPGQAIEHDADELEERVEKLSAHIDDARERLEDRVAEAQELGEAQDVVGDFEQTDDQAGGEDPVGAHAERDEPSEGSS